MSTFVADNGDIEAVRRFKALDCTTNPSIGGNRTLSDPRASEVEEIAVKVEANDLPNRRTVLNHSVLADFVLETLSLN